MKPLGARLTVGRSGPKVHVVPSTIVEDGIWQAVEDAVRCNWTIQQFINEAKEAWKEELRKQIEAVDNL